MTELKDVETGRVSQMNATFDDSYDGGNSIGWIEDVTQAANGIGRGEPAQLQGPGQVVAEIGDSWITCLAAIR